MSHTTDDPFDPDLTRGTDEGPVPQASKYLVLSEEERAKGFVRPLRYRYVHDTCRGATTMSQEIAETYARRPDFYSATYCVHCSMHRPVGASGEFVWEAGGERVGT